MASTDNASEEYESPDLIEYGSVEELTGTPWLYDDTHGGQ